MDSSVQVQNRHISSIPEPTNEVNKPTGIFGRRQVAWGTYYLTGLATCYALHYLAENHINPFFKELRNRAIERAARFYGYALYSMLAHLFCTVLYAWFNPPIEKKEFEPIATDELKKLKPWALSASQAGQSQEKDVENVFKSSTSLYASNLSYRNMLQDFVIFLNQNLGTQAYIPSYGGAIIDPTTGLKCAISLIITNDGKEQYCISFASSDDYYDDAEQKAFGTQIYKHTRWMNMNLGQFACVPLAHRQADEITKMLIAKKGRENVTTSGWSLGGNVASYVGLKNKIKVYIFNPSPLALPLQLSIAWAHPQYKQWAMENVTQVSIKGDWLSHARLLLFFTTGTNNIEISTSYIARLTHTLRTLVRFWGVPTRETFGKKFEVDIAAWLKEKELLAKRLEAALNLAYAIMQDYDTPEQLKNEASALEKSIKKVLRKEKTATQEEIEAMIAAAETLPAQWETATGKQVGEGNKFLTQSQDIETSNNGHSTMELHCHALTPFLL